MRGIEFLTGHMTYNPAYTEILQTITTKGWHGFLDAKGVRANAYVPRNRETCPSQVLYTRWDEDLRKGFMRSFSAHANESGKYVLTYFLSRD